MKKILSETRFYFAQCVFNCSCQYSAMGRYEKKRNRNRWISLIISSASVIVLVLIIVAWECGYNTCLKVLSFSGFFLTAASLIFDIYENQDMSELIYLHKQTAEDYKTLRDDFMDLIRRIMSTDAENDVDKRLQDLLARYSFIGKYALSTTYEDYVKAQKSLGLNGEGESFTWSDKEIDRFLPEDLRKNVEVEN